MAKTSTSKSKKAPDLKSLNFYYLQKAIYEAHAKYDQPATREEGRKRINAVYDEYARRGVTMTKRPVM
jgi:hypothetical protein